MATGLPYEQASRIAGELFGNLFARASDKGGYDYALKTLLSGEKSPRDLVREFMTSDEFRELHLMNQTPNEFARRALIRLTGAKRVDPEKIKTIAVKMLQNDWRKVVVDLIDSSEYQAVYGDNDVPLWI